MSPRRVPSVPRFEEIAIDVAQRIAQREWREGQRLFGRSSLAGLYKVSPETVRRAVALLHAFGIVSPVAGSGVVVVSRTAAEKYLQEARLHEELRGLAANVQDLLAQRRQLDERLAEVVDRMVHHMTSTLGMRRNVEEIPVPADSAFVGQTLTSANVRGQTGITVIGVARKGEEIFSPDPTMPLEPGDILLVVGAKEARERLRNMIAERGGEP